MKTSKIQIALLLLPSLSFATVKFNCYSLFNAPVQAYGAGSLNCATDAEPNKVIKRDGPTKVLCFYQAMCEPLAPGEYAEELSPTEVMNMQLDPTTDRTTSFKPAGVSCQGDGYIQHGRLVNIQCPPPNQCSTDVVFTAAMAANAYPGQNSVVVKPGYEKEKRVKGTK